MIYSKEDILVESTLACDLARISTASELMTEAYIDQMIESDTIESFFESGGSALAAIKKGILGTVQKIITFLRQQLEKLSDMLGEGEMKELMKEDPVPVLPEEYKKMLDKCDTWMSPKIPDMKEFFKLMQEAYEKKLARFNDYLIKSFQKLEKVSSYGDPTSKRVHVMNKTHKPGDEDYVSARYGYESADSGFDNHDWAMFLEAEESAGAISKVKSICSKLISNFNAMASKHSGLSTLIAGIMKQIKAFLKSVKDKKREIIAAAKKGKSVEKKEEKADKKGDK